MTDDDPQPGEGARADSESESIDSVLRAVAHEPSIAVAARTVEGVATPSSLEPTPLPRVGDVLGRRYRIEALLGAGGMGAVFAARHVKSEKELAIKVLLPRHGLGRFSSDRITRFVREAQAAGRIRHPNVVDVYDVEEGEGTPYLVMERLVGESLWQRIRRGPIAPAEAVPILLAAMRGVSEAHRQGVIHRDLKPDNIFLATTSAQAEPVPKVLDFGVSRIVARADSEDPHPTTITQTGYIVGTPAYMPLEQLRGERELSVRVDVYALGVILYEALCGERPYEAANNHELVIRMVTEPPTPLRQKLPDVDPSLEHVVMKALAPKPADRYPDVDSFAEALTRWSRGEAVSVAAPLAGPPLDARSASAVAPLTVSAPRPTGVSRRARVLSIVVVLALAAVGLTTLVLRKTPAAELPAQKAKPTAAEEAPAPSEAKSNAVRVEPEPPPPASPSPPAEPASERGPRKRPRPERPPSAPAGPARASDEGKDPATDVTLDDF